ncbi:MAG: PD-(D/E)XK nuclease family protein [Patescibacteria group bacterium]
MNLPAVFSFSQLKAYETCPYQYYLNFILKIPVTGKAVFSYGKTMHSTLQKFFSLIKDSGNINQGNLFRGESFKSNKIPSITELLRIYDESWVDDWYISKEIKEKYRAQGRESLKKLYNEIKETKPRVLETEKGFSFKIGGYTIRGVIDRVDIYGEKDVELVDYKTGSSKTEKTVEKDQLLIYQLAATETFGWRVKKLVFYYLDNNETLSFLGSEKELEKQREKIFKLIEKIKTGDFNATPSRFTCSYCDFKNICKFKEV